MIKFLGRIFGDDLPKMRVDEEITRFSAASLHRLVPVYWRGKENFFVRMWIYLQRGLNVVNEFKYLVAGVFGAYFTLKLVNPIWLLIMTVVSVIPLILLGRWKLQRVDRIGEYIGKQFGSVLGYNDWNNQVMQVDLLEGIARKMGVDVEAIQKKHEKKI